MKQLSTIKIHQLFLTAGVVLGALVVGVFLWQNLPNEGTFSYSDTDPGFNKIYWTEQIELQGPREAYKEFSERNAKAPAERQHFSAHVIGELLFQTQHEEGITTCDSNFGFGCYHGFFGRAVAAGGPDAIVRLDAKCVEAYGSLGTGCQHGMGHGILEYVGHEKINDALEMCKLTTQVVPLLGCSSGVFMEFNTPLAGPDTGLAPRTRLLDVKNPYEPCTTVPADRKNSCYFELGQWLMLMNNGDATRTGELCAGLQGSDRTHCYLGIGTQRGQRPGYSGSNTVVSCEVFAPEDALACWAGISWGLRSIPERRAEASAVCMKYSTTAEQEACTALADLTEGLDPN